MLVTIAKRNELILMLFNNINSALYRVIYDQYIWPNVCSNQCSNKIPNSLLEIIVLFLNQSHSKIIAIFEPSMSQWEWKR